MKYSVETRFYDNGEVTAGPVRMAEESEKSEYREIPGCDVYLDVFNDKDQAISCRASALATAESELEIF